MEVCGALRRHKRNVSCKLQWRKCDSDIITPSQRTHHLLKCTLYDAEPTYPINMFS